MKKIYLFFIFLIFNTTFFAQTTETFATFGTYNWVVPPCVTEVTVQVWGGGGGGGASRSQFTNSYCSTGNSGYEICTGGGGGGGGGFASRTYTIVPGQSYTIVVGAGGVGGTYASSGDGWGGWGNHSTFSGSATVTPGTLTGRFGAGAQPASYYRNSTSGEVAHAGANGPGGAGGTGLNGSTNLTGGNGALGRNSVTNTDMGGAGGGGAGVGAAGTAAQGNSNGGTGGNPGGNGANSPVISTYTGYQGANGNPGNTYGGGGGGGIGHNRGACSNTTLRLQIAGNGANGAVRITYPTPGADLISNGTRIAPTGAQCSGTQLNFQSIPTGGDGTYVYSWSTVPATITSTSNTFSPTLVNTGCSDITNTINLSVTGCGVTRTQTFGPTIRPIPTLSLGATVSCTAATVVPNGAQLCGAPCPTCSYVLQACDGCVPPSPVLGTSGSSFDLWGATSAGFSTTLNGCSSATQSLDFLSPPFNCAIPLSVDFNELISSCVDNKALLNWSTFTEINNDYYTIERSMDGCNFDEIAEVKGSGSTSQFKSYEWLDEKPINGISYYRLSQTDYDGSQKFLKIVVFNQNKCVDKSFGVQVFPNPINYSTIIQLELKQQAELSLSLLDITGRIIHEIFTKIKKESGIHKFNIDSQNIVSGIYFLRIDTDNGSELVKNIK